MSLIQPSFLNHVVALGMADSSGQDSVRFVATGFLYGYFASMDENGKPEYYPYLARIHRRTPMDGVRTAEEG